MRLDDQRESTNVEDRRGMSKGTLAAGGGIAAVIIALIAMFMGGGNTGDLLSSLENAATQQGGGEQNIPDTPEARAAKQFVSRVLGSTEDVWREILPAQGNRQYQDPVLVLFSGGVQSACGQASAATGPFYCPGDQKLYIDLSFFEELDQRFGAPGDFAQAYVVAHEVGHHVQKLLGISDMVHAKRAELDEVQYNQLSVRLELQADFLAGVWAHHAQDMKNVLEPGDLEEALRAANAIGDDRLQKQGQGRVVPDSFTHGTSEQRIRWFTKGFKAGDIRQGNTFEIPYGSL